MGVRNNSNIIRFNKEFVTRVVDPFEAITHILEIILHKRDFENLSYRGTREEGLQEKVIPPSCSSRVSSKTLTLGSLKMSGEEGIGNARKMDGIQESFHTKVLTPLLI